MPPLPIKVHLKSKNTRKRPTALRQTEILREQDNRCFYCGFAFYEWFNEKGYARCRTPCWDHVIPYSHSFNSNNDNFVAACGKCNGIKSAKLFTTYEEALDYVRKRRIEKGLTNGPRRANKKILKTMRVRVFNELIADSRTDVVLAETSTEELQARLESWKLVNQILKTFPSDINQQPKES